MKLNNLEKQNRRNRLDDKLKQQEFYGEIEELFDPLTKTQWTQSSIKWTKIKSNRLAKSRVR